MAHNKDTCEIIVLSLVLDSYLNEFIAYHHFFYAAAFYWLDFVSP